jgi:hypothetical protein
VSCTEGISSSIWQPEALVDCERGIDYQRLKINKVIEEAVSSVLLTYLIVKKLGKSIAFVAGVTALQASAL